MLRTKPDFQISGPVYSADQIIGKTLIARVPLKLYRYPNTTAAVVYTAKPGEAVGKVYSWTGGGASPLFWMYYDANGKTYYSLHGEGIYDIKALQEQGALTVEEVREQQNPPTPTQQIVNTVTTAIKWGLFAFIGFQAYKAISRTK